MKLTTRFTIIFFLYAGAFLAVVGLLAYSNGRNSLHAATISELSATAIEKQAALTLWVEDKQKDIRLVAADPAVIKQATALFAALPDSADRVEAHDHLVAEIQPRILGGEFLVLLLIDPATGEVIASTDPSEEGKIKGDRPFFINGKVGPYIQSVYYSVSLNRPAMTASAPLIAANGRLLGVLAGRVNLEELSSIIGQSSGLRETNDAFLVNTSKLFVTQPYLVGDPAVLQREFDTEAVNRCLMKTSGSIEDDDYRGVPSIITYHWLPEQDLCLIVKIDQAEAYGPARAFGGTVAAISAFSLLVAMIVAVVLSRSLTRPILALQAGAVRFGQGKLETKLPETSHDEFGELAHEFNKMAASLLEKDAELRAHTQTLEQRVQERTKELQESHAQLSRAEQIGHNGSWQWYFPEDRVVWSEGLYQVFGLAPQEFRGTYSAYIEQIHPDDQEFVRQAVGQALHEHKMFEYECRIVRPAGQLRSILTRGEVVLGEQGMVTRVIGVVLDITERKQAEETLRESESRYRELFESESDALFLIDNASGNLLEANGAAVALYGYDRNELLTKRNVDLSAEPEETQRVTHGTPVISDRIVTIPLRFHRKKDGTVFPVEITGRFFRRQGRPVHIAAIRDITERQQVEEALQTSEALFRTAFQYSPVGMCLTTLDGRFLNVNQALGDMLGFTRGELQGKHFNDITHPEDLEIGRYVVRQALSGDLPSISFEKRYLRKTGEPVWVHLNASLLKDSSGKPIHFITHILNITERKRAEEALRESQEKIRNIIRHSSSMFYTHTTDHILTYVSPQSRDILDCEPEEAMVYWPQFLSDNPLNRQGIDATKQAIETGCRQPPYELELITHKDRKIWVQVDESPLIKDGETIAIVGSITDITERKKAQESLTEKERLLSESQRIGHIGSWSYDIAADTLVYSDEMYRLFDVSPQEFQHNSEGFLGLIYSSDRPVVARWMKNIRVGSQADEIEFLIFCNNGELRYIRCRGAVEFDKVGKPARFIGTAQDITERKLAEIQIGQQVEYLTALRKIDQAISSSFDLNVTLDILLSQVISQLRVDAADVLLLKPEGQILEYASGRGFRTQAIESERLRMTDSQAGRAARERRTIHVESLQNKPDKRLLTPIGATEGFVCYFGIPLIVKGKVKGVLEIFHRAPLQPYPEWLDFLNTLAGQAAIAIEDAQLFENLDRSNRELFEAYDATIEGWSRALDLRDRDTEGHTERVTEMMIKLARAYGLPEEQLLHIRRGCLLHDIGKMGVPDCILHKPSELTKDEWVIMKTHPSLAFEMLSPITYLKPSLDIPYCHHEKWDGTGYPRGLKGEEIPLVARLFAVVDVWDALLSDRPYRKAWSTEQAREYIHGQAGIYFDPKVVEYFLELIKE